MHLDRALVDPCYVLLRLTPKVVRYLEELLMPGGVVENWKSY